MATGLINQTIWINKRFESSPLISSILLHELTHIKQWDPQWMWLICFTNRVFWWNPFMIYLVKYSKEQIEISCDEQCLKQQPYYQTHLAELFLVSTRHQTFPSYLGIKQNENFNIKRIKMLSKEKIMKKRYWLLLGVSVALSTLVGAGVDRKSGHVNTFDFFQDNFDLSLFHKSAESKESEITQMINEVNAGTTSLPLESNIKSFVDLGFADDLINSQYFCSITGCILFLSLNPENSRADKYRAESYISAVDKQYWYDFRSKNVFESNNNYYLVLQK